jgi:hypothetical protein
VLSARACSLVDRRRPSINAIVPSFTGAVPSQNRKLNPKKFWLFDGYSEYVLSAKVPANDAGVVHSAPSRGSDGHIVRPVLRDRVVMDVGDDLAGSLTSAAPPRWSKNCARPHRRRSSCA